MRGGGRAGDGKNSAGEVLIQHYYFSHVLLEEPYLHGDTYNLICLVHEFLFSLFGGGSSEKVVIWKLESIVHRKMVCGDAYWYLS